MFCAVYAQRMGPKYRAKCLLFTTAAAAEDDDDDDDKRARCVGFPDRYRYGRFLRTAVCLVAYATLRRPTSFPSDRKKLFDRTPRIGHLGPPNFHDRSGYITRLS